MHRPAVHVRESHDAPTTNKQRRTWPGPITRAAVPYPRGPGVLCRVDMGVSADYHIPRPPSPGVHHPRTIPRKVTLSKPTFYPTSQPASVPAYARCPRPGKRPINSPGLPGFCCLFYSSLIPGVHRPSRGPQRRNPYEAWPMLCFRCHPFAIRGGSWSRCRKYPRRLDGIGP